MWTNAKPFRGRATEITDGDNTIVRVVVDEGCYYAFYVMGDRIVCSGVVAAVEMEVIESEGMENRVNSTIYGIPNLKDD
jgi:hypothetical protein